VKLLPYESFEIETPLSKEEVIEMLNSQIEPWKLFRWPWKMGHKVFQGSVTSDKFKISKIIHYRNSFLPIIHGTFGCNSSGNVISIKMTLHPMAIVFMCAWFLLLLIGIMNVLLGASNDKSFPLIGFIIIIISYIFIGVCFWPEVKEQKRVLMEMFKGKG
jgi:hypothetical protein